MNIFERKLGNSSPPNLPIHPVELFQTLFHAEGYEYLRGVQEEILNDWHAIRPQRDVIGKMNTGSGKTLTGLLMLYSKLVEGVGPVVYLCPDHQLVSQTIEQANNYGIPVCTFDGKDFPIAFKNKLSVLVCTFDKLFNGRSKFGVRNVDDSFEQLGAVLLDDAHACVARAREKSTIKVKNDHDIYKRLLPMFDEDLRNQAAGTLERLRDGDPTANMRVPYWAWIDKNPQILKIINEHRDKDEIGFPWGLLADDLLTCDCFISGEELEIAPVHVPYHQLPSFDEAKHRFILSATFDDDTHLLKDLGISNDSILNPLVPKDRKDIGERLIIAPSRFDNSLTDDLMRKFIAKLAEKVNVVVLVPSKNYVKPWEKLGATIVDKDNIKDALTKLRSSVGNLMVFKNRYDGVDLLGSMCRVLVLDGKPAPRSLQARYSASLKSGFNGLDARLAQTIEQGLGRGVRSGSDYCVVFLLNPNLVSFLGYDENLEYFAPITRQQLNLGLTLLDGEDKTKPLNQIFDVVKLCLSKDVSWRKYHQQEIMKVTQDQITESQKQKLTLAKVEQSAIRLFRLRRYDQAANCILDFLKTNPPWMNTRDRASYYQLSAQMHYLADKVESNNLQTKAAEMSSGMFHPALGPVYTRITKPGVQASIVRRRLAEFSRPQDVTVYLESILDYLQYSPEIKADHFEEKLAQLGSFLGFNVQLPEKELGNGPDVLWCMTDNHYLLLEAKSRSTHQKITRANIEQLYHSEVWFNNQYGQSAEYSLITLQPPNKKENDVSINSKTYVIDQTSLDDLRQNLRHFVRSLQTKQTSSHTETEIASLLRQYQLAPELFRQKFFRQIT
ncbi:DEAD/DEAH box helicase [uncultured Brevibacillus sp.]|uniref:DEAD/DEAH box helicase n=1 Tax=uncultured Brevibacillus sp. TaxID=169970 RepID=UPI002599237B|nr:DEAD/DEAH box helicase [uncultured Brevibacillus sp.]